MPARQVLHLRARRQTLLNHPRTERRVMHAPPLAHNLDPCLCGCHCGSLGSQHAAAAFHAAKQTKPASRPQCGHQPTLTERVNVGSVGWSAYRQSSSGSKVCRRKATIMASCSRLSTGECASFGPMAASAVVWRLRHFCTVVGLMPWRRASALTLSWLRCIARRTASVVVVLPWRT